MTPTEGPGAPGPGTPTDEELARQARGGSHDAATALLERCEALIRYLIGYWFRRGVLQPEELEEVRQEAQHGFLLAVTAYAVDRDGGPGGARFRTFMYRVVWNHLDKWERRRRRAESYYDRSVDWAAKIDGRALRTFGDTLRLTAPDHRAGDPADFAMWQETCARLTAAFQRLDPTQRWLLDQRTTDRSLRELADESGLSYDRVKRLIRRAMAFLREALL
jgi:RNA polymerase sigma factor (sigma-70 family)